MKAHLQPPPTPTTLIMSDAAVSPLSHFPQKPSQNVSFWSCLTQSLTLLLHNKSLFLSIFALLTLPISFLLFYLSLASHPVKSHILHLESVAAISSTRFEGRHVWKEARESAILILRLRLLFFIPSYLLSLLAAVASVSATQSIYSHAKPTTLRASLAPFKSTWSRPLTTSICVYAILLLYSAMLLVLSAVIAGSGVLSFSVWVVGSGLEIYLMAVLGMSLVVSIAEKRFGWDAIRTGSDLMEGRRACGVVLSGVWALVTAVIGWRMEGLAMMNGWDESGEIRWTRAMAMMMGWEGVALTVLYGVVVMWSYVVNTIFYCECRKRHVVGDNGHGNEIEC